MRTSILSLGALAMGLVSAHEYPYCEADNCYNELTDKRFADEAKAFCPEFLAGTTTAASAIPTNFENCEGSVAAVSSACSCITYSDTPTSTAPPTTESTKEATTTEVPETSTTEAPEPTTTEEPEESTTEACEETETEEPESSTSTTKWTTSTLTTTTTRTITQCPETVTDCPAHSTRVTTEIIVTTTVCPVTDEPEGPTTTDSPSFVPSSTEFGTITIPSTSRGPQPTSSVPVTAGAGRAVRGVEGIAAVAGLFAAFL
ncbi:putative cell wall protein sed1 protein [Chaetomidium leptoderma]|uniref:Cell wall protein sed1 protein n=1 Tax=Chaetomidium leptoderma TaxID=669021 RepID=A0AAN6VKZ4_9PEZI|nr:putative cell wall protein sed1 protein [Chaetomidium leptoderma]